MDEFIKDRNEAFLSLDKEKIIAYCKKYDVTIPKDETVFWAGVHKVICNLFLLEDSPVDVEMWLNSCNWLSEHGYSPIIKDTIKKTGEKNGSV